MLKNRVTPAAGPRCVDRLNRNEGVVPQAPYFAATVGFTQPDCSRFCDGRKLK